MARFNAVNDSEGFVPADRGAIWDVLTDPVKLAAMTPLLDRIEVDGDLWRWEMARIPVLGVSVAPAFTECMQFEPQTRIHYTHCPPDGRPERAAVEGTYLLEDVEGGTKVSMHLDICVDLPLPRAAGPAVRGVMAAVMQQMGNRFAVNLEKEVASGRVA